MKRVLHFLLPVAWYINLRALLSEHISWCQVIDSVSEDLRNPWSDRHMVILHGKKGFFLIAGVWSVNDFVSIWELLLLEEFKNYVSESVMTY